MKTKHDPKTIKMIPAPNKTEKEKRKREKFLEDGDIIKLEKGMRVYYSIPSHFVFQNTVGDFKSLHHTEVTIGETRCGEKGCSMSTDFLVGRYVVTKTQETGGGTGHGPHDVYPDGHHITAQNLEHKLIKVTFYQSGSFTAMIEPHEIQAVGKAKIRWVEQKPSKKGTK